MGASVKISSRAKTWASVGLGLGLVLGVGFSVRVTFRFSIRNLFRSSMYFSGFIGLYWLSIGAGRFGGSHGGCGRSSGYLSLSASNSSRYSRGGGVRERLGIP